MILLQLDAFTSPKIETLGRYGWNTAGWKEQFYCDGRTTEPLFARPISLDEAQESRSRTQK